MCTLSCACVLAQALEPNVSSVCSSVAGLRGYLDDGSIQ